MFLEPMAWLKVKGSRNDNNLSVYEVLAAWAGEKSDSEMDVVVEVSGTSEKLRRWD